MTRATLRLSVDQAVSGMKEAIADGLYLGMEYALSESRKVVPLDEATLERSGVASVDPGTLTGAVSYSTPYAVRQHEDLTAHHLPGRTAKYLEDPFAAAGDQIMALVAAKVRQVTR
ncbi:hypothetical protein [Embleya hyalina]|uniref:HK97 gp10 family phage protein n=1 Tax=Embleya hyalina TaxID=516124 RepID=A0A401YHK7_9ACTN|nr:hypothetical protein [Embleya hyalina]GCD94073.1 hypothetical protein EHYA_01729 [Embleya hyalina]